ncbi:mCG1036157 [Mus musculus]|nr:mCG1036157 [Mus musculus]
MLSQVWYDFSQTWGDDFRWEGLEHFLGSCTKLQRVLQVIGTPFSQSQERGLWSVRSEGSFY